MLKGRLTHISVSPPIKDRLTLILVGDHLYKQHSPICLEVQWVAFYVRCFFPGVRALGLSPSPPFGFAFEPTGWLRSGGRVGVGGGGGGGEVGVGGVRVERWGRIGEVGEDRGGGWGCKCVRV